MSLVAEFARELHERESVDNFRPLSPFRTFAQAEKLFDVHAVIFDVYGTLVNYWMPAYTGEEGKLAFLEEAFDRTARQFGMTDFLAVMNPADPPAKTLRDFYHGLIALDHEKSRKRGIEYPEVKIERIWELIILMLKRHGYSIDELDLGDSAEVSRCVAYYYNFHALGRGFFPGVVDALTALREKNIKLGIVSNAQFYTPIDLTLFLRDQSNNRLDDYLELFDVDLVLMSYQVGRAKPGKMLFEKLYDALYELHILPEQTVFVGNDLISDIAPARQAGMRTAFFSGDRASSFTHGREGSVVPDIAFSGWEELPDLLSFYEEKPSESRK
ncbi:MAG: HAD hydrolase-like protein [Chitinivibrionales bacterium]|nr:HAD hydrolase-like protein [Chitinivibrionales bacterium]MBD3356245.1 HAD hydrolase-like protein [Chitinivibrionales bacterium]